MSKCLRLFLSVILGSLAGPILAQNLSLQPRTANDAPFQLSSTTGFSVSNVSGEYRLFATFAAARFAWVSTNPAAGLYDSLGIGATFPCDINKSPVPPGSSWTNPPAPYVNVPACIDSIALFSKSAASTDSSAPRWTVRVSPAATISAFESPTGSPPWPNVGVDVNNVPRFGVPSLTPIITRQSITVPVSLPQENTACHPANPTSAATGAANGKAVQVFYSGGVSRWYMAFNETVHDNAYSYNDDFRILWATSTDGRSWTVYNSFVLRKPASVCVGGLLVTDLFLNDDSRFYLVFTDGNDTNKVYLARASFAGAAPAIPGYTSSWEIAGNPIVGGQYTWRTIPGSYLTSGAPVNMGPGTCTSAPPNPCSLDAASMIPADQYNTATGYFVKQAAITRVFASSAAGSASRYVALTADRVGEGGGEFGRLYSSDSLSKPFQYEHQDLGGSGNNGFEPGFTHYPDNLSGSPRIFAQGFDLWLVGNGCPGNSTPFCSTTVARSTYALTGGIFSLPPAPTSVTPTSGPATGGNVVTIYGSNFHAGATVRFGGVSSTGVTVVSATQISAIAPAHAVGAVAVDVTNTDYPSGTSGFTSLTGSLANAYTDIALASLSLNPTSVGGGSPSTGTVTLTSYATGGAVVSLSSLNPSVASVPSSVSGNFSTTTFTVTTHPVSVDTPVTITASYGGVSRQATLTVRKVAWGGFHDFSRCDMSWGWAWDANRPNTPIQVSIYYEGGYLNTIWADSYRQELVNAGIGNGVHAFWYTHPPQIQDGATHSISIYAGNPWDGLGLSLLGWSPRSFACSVSARVIWIQPQYTAGFGPPGSLVVAGSASGAPAGTTVLMYWRDVTLGTGWNLAPYPAPTDSGGIWYNCIENVNFTHQYSVYVTYAAVTSGTCTYSGNGAQNWCP